MKKGFSHCDAPGRTSSVNNLPRNLNLLELNRSRTPSRRAWHEGSSVIYDSESSGQSHYVSSDSSSLLKPQEVAKLFLPDSKARRNSCSNLKKKAYCNHCDASEHNNMKAFGSPAGKHVGDFHYDLCSNDVKSPRSKTQENADGGDHTDMSTSRNMPTNKMNDCTSNPFFLNQKRCVGRKPKKLSRARRSTLSVIQEGKFELHSGDYFRGPPHPDLGMKSNRTVAVKLHVYSRFQESRDTSKVNFPFTIPISRGKPSVEELKDRSGPSLESLGVCKGELNIEGVCAPPKTKIHEALFRRVAEFINPDVSIFIDCYEFLCHKIVLQCYSEYFEELKNHSEVAVEGVTKAAFISIYNWMLAPGNEGIKFIQKNNILEMLIASKVLIIKELENQCLAFIDSKEAFSEENAYLLFIDASRRQQTEIMELMVPRIQTFFLVLVSTVDFTELEVGDLCTILQSNYIVVHCEMEVFMAAVKWLMANWEERSKLLGVVMKCIRFGLMTPAQLVDIRKNPMSPQFIEIANDKTVQMLIEDGLAYSVESSLTGKTDQHNQRCQLLKLNVPEPRNWAPTRKEYSSYEDFLNYLGDIAKDPRSFYAEIRRDCAISKPFANDITYTTSSSSDECSDSKVQAAVKPMLTGGPRKPSLSDLLCKEATKKNVKRVVNQNGSTKPERLQPDKTSDDWTVHKNPVRASKTTQDFIVQAHVDKGCPYRAPPRRLSLTECAAIVIQATYRGYRARKSMRRAPVQTEWKGEPEKPALEDGFLHVTSNTDREHAVSDGNFSSARRGRRDLTSRTTSVRSSSSEDSNDSITSVKLGPAPASRRKAIGEKSVLVIGGINPCSGPSPQDAENVYKYSFENNSWDKVDTMPSPRYYHSSSILKGKVYIVGGCNPNQEVNGDQCIATENFSYDPNSGRWSKEPELRTPRRSFGLVTMANCLYAIGGQDKHDTILPSVERYDLQRRIWEEVAPLPKPTIGAATGVYKNQIWVAGGMNGTADNITTSKDVWCYDPRHDTWAKKPPLRFGRAFGALTTFEDSLLLVGGFTSENGSKTIVSNDNIDVWDGENMMWKLKGHMEDPRHGHSIALLGSVMILMGGVTTGNDEGLSRVDTLCMSTGSRSKRVAPLPSPLVGHSSVLYSVVNAT